MENNPKSLISITFTEALMLVFIVLKLCGVINWSWWIILIPLWVPIALIILVFALIIIIRYFKNE